MTRANRSGTALARTLPWIVLAAGVTLALWTRVRLLDVPLERDEGEYAYAGQLILEGVPPYVEADNMKLPGTYYAYALLLALFGRTTAGIHLGLAIWTTLSALFVFLIGRRLYGPLGGAVAASVFAILGISESVLGLAGHATHFIVLPALIGCWLLLGPRSRGNAAAFTAGLAFGVAFLMKQHAAALAIFGGLFLLWKLRRSGLAIVAPLVLFTLGVSLPYLLFCLYAFWNGVFETFWFWTVTYAAEYATALSVTGAPQYLVEALSTVVSWSLPLWLLAGAGAVILFLRPRTLETRVFSIGFAVFSFLAVCPGFYFREHYFIVLFPALGLLAAAGLAESPDTIERERISRFRAGWLAAVLIAAAVTVGGQRNLFFSWSAARVDAEVYPGNPFSEVVEIARYIRERSTPEDRIAVLGSEPEIYFYADRRAAARYVYVYALMEEHDFALELQRKVIGEIEAVRPPWVVVVRLRNSWLWRPTSNRRILSWMASYLDAHYTVEGIVEMWADAPSSFRWGPEVRNARPTSDHYLIVCRRKG